MPVSEYIESGLITRLEPLCESSGGPLKDLYVRPFSNLDQLASLIQIFQDKTPAGFLSIDDATINNASDPAGRVQRFDITYNCAFAVAFGTAEITAKRLAAVRAARNTALALLKSANLTPPARWALDPITVASFMTMDTPVGQMCIVAFNVRARSTATEVTT